jgi:predicted outer membrane repeat protein
MLKGNTVMAKKIILLFTVVLIFTACFTSIPSSAAEIDFAIHVKGGGKEPVKTVEQLAACFDDEYGVSHADVEGSTVYLKDDVVLLTPIVISYGTYTLDGRGCTVYRGFSDGALIGLDGTKDSPSLYIGSSVREGETWEPLTDEPNITFDGNMSQYPVNGIGLIVVKGQAALGVSGKTVFRNSAADRGAAIYMESYEDGTADNTLRSPDLIVNATGFTGCSTVDGGILYVECEDDSATLSINGAVFKNNSSAQEALSGLGSCVRSEGGTVSISASTFEACEANYGGSIYINSTCTIDNSTFTYGGATDEGGAIYVAKDGDMTLDTVTVSNNTAGKKGGGISNYGLLTVKGMSFIMDNTADGYGGGVYNEGTLNIDEVNLVGNVSKTVGGGIFSEGERSIINMNGGEIKNNKAKYVAALYCEGKLTMSAGGIAKNKSDFPQVLLKKDADISANALISGGDTVGLCRTEVSDGVYYYPVIEVSKELREGVLIKIALCSEKTDKNGGIVAYNNITSNNSRIFSCPAELEEKCAAWFEVQSRGLLSYTLKDGGTVSVKFIFLPIWAWLLIVFAIVIAVCFVFRAKIFEVIQKIIAKFKKKKTPIIHHKKR